MASVFTRVVDGELPCRFVWRDLAALDAAADRIRAFLPEFGHAERAG